MISKLRYGVAVLFCLVAFGCTSSNIWLQAYGGYDQSVREMVAGGQNLDGLNYEGTPLCYAVKADHVSTVQLLLDMNADVNGGNPTGARSRTPLHQAGFNNSVASARILLEHGADVTITNRDSKTALEVAMAAGNYEVAEVIRDYGTTYSSWEQCRRSPSIDCVEAFIAKWPKSGFIAQAKQRLILLREEARKARAAEELRIAALKKAQTCKLKEDNWVYNSKACRNGYANGTGEAEHVNGTLRFEGTFKNGKRTRGIIYQNDEPLFDGAIVAGKPDGMGVCYNNGEPEECRYYKGKRIDTLYKQRIEMAAQTRYMEMLKDEIEKLKRGQVVAANGGPEPTTMSDDMMSALKKEAARQITGAIFDQLF